MTCMNKTKLYELQHRDATSPSTQGASPHSENVIGFQMISEQIMMDLSV
jgi:hypothetical protein